MKTRTIFFLTIISCCLLACGTQADGILATIDLNELGNQAATEIVGFARTQEPLILQPGPLTNPGFCQPGGLSDNRFLVIGYLPEYRPFDISTANCLSDLIFFSLEPTMEGTLDTSRITPERIAELLEASRLYNIRLHVSLGGWGRNGGFSSMVVDPDKRTRFIDELVAFLYGNGITGVDFDWEFPETEEEKNGYAALIQETRQAISPQGGIVSVAFYPNPELDITPYLSADRVHVMSYDRDTRHATYDQAVADVELFLNLGVPPEKIILGLPFYGRVVEPPFTAYSYQDIYDQYAPAAEQDEAEGIFFNGQDTIQAKTCYAIKNGLGGVMIWEIGQDIQPGSGNDGASLLRGMYQVVNGGCE